MRNEPRKEMIRLAAESQGHDPIAKAVTNCIEGEFVSARTLRGELEAAGYEIKETARKVLTRVEVFKDGTQIAYAESGDAGDALLQAALAYLRSAPAPEETAAA